MGNWKLVDGQWVPRATGLAAALTEGIVRSITVTLTDAQIKALPTTAIEILPDSGPGFLVFAVGGFIRANTNAGAYTNIDAAAWVRIRETQDNMMVLSPVEEAASGVSDLLGTGSIMTVLLGPRQGVLGASSLGFAIADTESAGIDIRASNGAAGNLTGGHPDNSMTVTVIYTVVAL